MASAFNEASIRMNMVLKSWFVLGYYASVYELACKCLVTIANNLRRKTANLSCGDARTQLRGRYQLREVADYFDNFLRNAINHSQYIITDLQAGKVDVWDIDKDTGKSTPKQQRAIMDVFKKTLGLLLLILAILATGNEAIIHRASM